MACRMFSAEQTCSVFCSDSSRSDLKTASEVEMSSVTGPHSPMVGEAVATILQSLPQCGIPNTPTCSNSRSIC